MGRARGHRLGMTPRVSIVIPAYNEADGIVPLLDRVFDAVTLPCEVLVVYDRVEDTTAPYLEKYAQEDSRLRPTLNTYGPGPARALRFGVDNSASDVVVVTMADGSDDPQQIDHLARLVERGAVVAAASRYTRGGRQVGGPRLKGLLSRLAGLSLRLLAGVGTRDATNSFKAYSTNFLREVGIDAEAGFEMGIEMVAKARRLRRPVVEIPTVWRDRTVGTSRFRLADWIPKYLRWYRLAFGPRLTPEQLRSKIARSS
jgi:dolichol-phosphate mannosyltransferase